MVAVETTDQGRSPKTTYTAGATFRGRLQHDDGGEGLIAGAIENTERAICFCSPLTDLDLNDQIRDPDGKIWKIIGKYSDELGVIQEVKVEFQNGN
jgi:hypothetical protein